MPPGAMLPNCPLAYTTLPPTIVSSERIFPISLTGAVG